MTEEPLFEVWVDGMPWLSPHGSVRRFTRTVAEAKAGQWRWRGQEAVVVPDQSKRPPDHEMLQDR